MNERRPSLPEHERIARNDKAVKLGFGDWCGFPLNASERTSEQALSCLLELRPM